MKEEFNEFKNFYKTVGGAEGNKCYYPTRLDLYGKGCFYDCKYCYAKKILNFRKMWHPSNVAVADIDKISKTIKNKINKGDVVRLGGMTDCFQPIEELFRNTYETIQMLNEKRVHYIIVTKSDLVANPKYLSILDKELAHIQISIPSTDNDVLRNTDNAPSFENRVRAIETLQQKGFDVSLRLSPFLYETCDFDKINNINVDKCLVEFLRLTPKISETINDYITFENYSIKESGYRHLTLDKKCEALSKLDFEQITVCDDVDEHYNYFKENYNPNPNDCCNLRL